ncbi:MAG: acetyl/propionyl/methylcrotonyl-CoA carboxylase subunit alpha [Gammaproteobacteria bacterium]|nr:acetyl/propionyl/methylcrotonyl-CoA carboxylase subunit alpha [Gammaproteobacteria bacterium]QOJ31922.1 MAG: acetyl/propionyl/methylcrotonyl-CoA carboxylase subunit alpha [Gammaproteobacteria bacterium]
MFKKILIANRGEIACRIIRTARRMGIGTVAVYSDADRRSLHVRMADEAVHIGPSPSAQSYLVAERIIQACRDTGAEAVHPGFGFLSERATFAEALAAAGIVFIGPRPHAITSMGDKIASKLLAQKAGVTTIPGFTGVIEGADHAVEIARGIGYPVMLKASAGGGGKGMRVVRNDAECRDGFLRATNEAVASFGDGRVFAEKFIEDPRHVEIQVLADQHGHVIYLGERECSIQRRHQKVLEEAPSPLLDEKTRRAMGEQAVALAKAVDYCSAGTVEFVTDQNRNFYFLEMNTRLQVEHPVTEMVTGVDLVELMIRVAAGEKLPLSQKDVKLKGWALEARVYAEDPFRNFLPSTGRLVRCRPPQAGDAVRIDTGIEEGSEVSMFYDPMIAKLVTWGETRAQAIDRMQDALDAYYIRGVSHNIGFLNAVLSKERFRQGRLSTGFIAEEYPDGFSAADVPQADPGLLIAVAASVHRRFMDRAARLSGQLPSHERVVGDAFVVIVNRIHHAVTVQAIPGGCRVRVGTTDYEVISDWQMGQPLMRGSVNGEAICIQVDRVGIRYRLTRRGSQVDALVVTPSTAAVEALMLEKQPPDLSKFLLSPMPGLLKRLAVKVGDEIKAGEELAVVEAMKMENSLRATDDVKVGKILATEGQSLAVDQPILAFD